MSNTYSDNEKENRFVVSGSEIFDLHRNCFVKRGDIAYLLNYLYNEQQLALLQLKQLSEAISDIAAIFNNSEIDPEITPSVEIVKMVKEFILKAVVSVNIAREYSSFVSNIPVMIFEKYGIRNESDDLIRAYQEYLNEQKRGDNFDPHSPLSKTWIENNTKGSE